MKKTPLRTEDARFQELPDYPFQPHYLELAHPLYAPLRMHYVDEGPTGGVVVLLLHGCPAWSYLYRKVIHRLQVRSPALRIIAPDHIGCGKSDKLPERSDYSYQLYVDNLRALIARLDLRRIVLVGQDWGGPIGLRVMSEMPERFAGAVLTNTLLPNAEAPPRGIPDWPGRVIEQWVSYTQQAKDMPVGQIIQGVCTRKLSTEVMAAYDAPFPDARYKQGMLNWPSLIPQHSDSLGIAENRKAWDFLERSTIPMLTAFSDQDPSTAAWESVFQQRVRGAQHIQHRKIPGAGHMVQEDAGETLGEIIVDFVAKLDRPASVTSR